MPDAPQPSYLRDLIYGAIDGSVTTFAIVAGVAGAGLPPGVIVTLGIANVLADGFSMAAGNYSGTKAEADNADRLNEIVRAHIRDNPDAAMNELREVLATKGLNQPLLDTATQAIAKDTDAILQFLLEGRYGIGPLEAHPLRSALATFGAFLLIGLIPLLPFMLGIPNAFAISATMTMVSFFGIGAAKAHWSLFPWWRSGLETLFIGGTAAMIAYVVGTFFSA